MATFNLYDEIGSGGYGNVYKSARVIDGKAGEIIYAVKKLKKNLDENAIERFKREVRILKILNHPNIIKVITENLECDEPFYVMPLYKQSLKGILDELKEAKRIEEEKDGHRSMSFLGSPIFTIVCCN